MKKRNGFTFLEVLLSASLLALILSFAFFWYHHDQKERKIFNQIKEGVYSERNAEIEMRDALGSIKKSGLFFTKNESHLVFIFNNGVQRSPLLSNEIVGEIFLDSKRGELLFVKWPHPETKRWDLFERSVLLDNISDLKFDFYAPRDERIKIVKPEEINEGPRIGWQGESLWKKEYKRVPAIIKVKMTHGDSPLIFYFILNECSPIPILER